MFQVQLAAAGEKQAARNVGRYIKRIEQDVATANALPVVVPSSNGSFVSYRFDPTLHALERPELPTTRPNMLLKPMSIPALVVIVCHEDDLKRFKTIRLHSSTRWVPRDKLIHRIVNPLPLKNRLQSEKVVKHIGKIDSVYREMQEIVGLANNTLPAKEQKVLFSGFEHTYATLLNRVKDLAQKAGTSNLDVPIPELARSNVKVTPSELTTAQILKRNELHFAVSGHPLKDIGPNTEIKAYLGGLPLRPINGEQAYVGPSEVYVFKLDKSNGTNLPEILMPGVYDFALVAGNKVKLAPQAVTIIDPDEQPTVDEAIANVQKRHAAMQVIRGEDAAIRFADRIQASSPIPLATAGDVTTGALKLNRTGTYTATVSYTHLTLPTRS